MYNVHGQSKHVDSKKYFNLLTILPVTIKSNSNKDVYIFFLYISSDPYVIAERSVTLSSCPPSLEFLRSEVRCAGFLIYSLGKDECQVCFLERKPCLSPKMYINITSVFKVTA